MASAAQQQEISLALNHELEMAIVPVTKLKKRVAASQEPVKDEASDKNQ